MSLAISLLLLLLVGRRQRPSNNREGGKMAANGWTEANISGRELLDDGEMVE